MITHWSYCYGCKVIRDVLNQPNQVWAILATVWAKAVYKAFRSTQLLQSHITFSINIINFSSKLDVLYKEIQPVDEVVHQKYILSLNK